MNSAALLEVIAATLREHGVVTDRDDRSPGVSCWCAIQHSLLQHRDSDELDVFLSGLYLAKQVIAAVRVRSDTVSVSGGALPTFCWIGDPDFLRQIVRKIELIKSERLQVAKPDIGAP